MLLWVWGAHAIPAALPAARPEESQQVRPTPSLQFMLDADTCLAPEAGLFSPGGFSPYSVVIRDMLLGDTANKVVVQVVVQPWISSPYSLRLEQLPQTGGAREANTIIAQSSWHVTARAIRDRLEPLRAARLTPDAVARDQQSRNRDRRGNGAAKGCRIKIGVGPCGLD